MSGFMFQLWSCNEPPDHYNYQLYYHYQWGSWSKADCSAVLLEQTILHFRFFFPHRRTSLWCKVLVAHYLSTQGDYFSMFLKKYHLCLYVFIKNVIWISDRFYSEMHWSKKKQKKKANGTIDFYNGLYNPLKDKQKVWMKSLCLSHAKYTNLQKATDFILYIFVIFNLN